MRRIESPALNYEEQANLLLNFYSEIGNLYRKIMKQERLDEDDANKIANNLRILSKIKDGTFATKCEKYIKIFSSFQDKLQDINKVFSNTSDPCGEGIYPQCHICCESSSKTTSLLCNHSICMRCMRVFMKKTIEGKEGVFLIKCPVQTCYNILTSSELNTCTNTTTNPYKPEHIKEICPQCGKKYELDVVEFPDCKHTMCRNCFKLYGEYKTGDEVVIGIVGNYQGIPCPYPSCGKNIPALVLLELYPPIEQKLLCLRAEQRVSNSI